MSKELAGGEFAYMELHTLINDLDIINQPIDGLLDMEIRGITDNSAEVERGFLFFAIEGYEADGHDYIEEAVLSGASAVIGEKDIYNQSVPYIQVKNSRKALGIISNIFFGNQSSQKIMIGITGTNGKTTISYMLKYILEKNGISCSVIGTIQNIVNGENIESENTTPSSLEVHKLISSSNDDVMIMEVSSHGLTQYRLEGVEFDFCLFTNLDHEHLDYHGSMENYFEAKSMLFEKMKPEGHAIINADDPWGEKLGELLRSQGKKTYLIGGSDNRSLKILDYHLSGTPSISLNDHGELVRISLLMPGLHNLYNSSMAYLTARKLHVSKENVLEALHDFRGVPGRFEVLRQQNGSTVVIDYAHTADAIFHSLKTARDCGAERIIHIFGFRGDRDTSKRGEILSVSSELSDLAILTMDDLNSTSFEDMVATLHKLNERYFHDHNNSLIIPDRTMAIKKALEIGQQGDWIVITGKGHEPYKQTFCLPANSDKDTILYINKQNNENYRIIN